MQAAGRGRKPVSSSSRWLACACAFVAITAPCAVYSSGFTAAWSLALGEEAVEEVRASAAMPDGGVVLVGTFTGTTDLGSGLPLESAGFGDAFIVRLNSDGVHMWSMAWGGIGQDVATGVAVDASGNITAVGTFENAVDFGGGPLFSVVGSQDVFVVSVQAVGVHRWSGGFGGFGDDVALGVAVDSSGAAIVAGAFEATIDFGGGDLTSSGNTDGFIASFTSSGVHSWSQRFGDAEEQAVKAIAVDHNDNVYVAGDFSGQIDLGGGALAATGTVDVFAATFTAGGVHRWSQAFGGTGTRNAGAIAVDSQGGFALTGNFAGSVDFGLGNLDSAGGEDVFLAQFTDTQSVDWQARFGDSDDQYGRDVVHNPGGAWCVLGDFFGGIDFGAGTLTSAGSSDIFLAEFDSEGVHIASGSWGDSSYQTAGAATVPDQGFVLIAGVFNGTIDFGQGDLTASFGGEDLFVAKLLTAGLFADGFEIGSTANWSASVP